MDLERALAQTVQPVAHVIEPDVCAARALQNGRVEAAAVVRLIFSLFLRVKTEIRLPFI